MISPKCRVPAKMGWSPRRMCALLPLGSLRLHLPRAEDAQVIPLIGQRGRIAERMALSRRTAADVTTVMDVDMGQVVAVRASTHYSYTAYVAWATAQALHEFPLLNAWVLEDRIIVKSAVHMGVAVAIEGALVVPVIRNVERMSVGEIDQADQRFGRQGPGWSAHPG